MVNDCQSQEVAVYLKVEPHLVVGQENVHILQNGRNNRATTLKVVVAILEEVSQEAVFQGGVAYLEEGHLSQVE